MPYLNVSYSCLTSTWHVAKCTSPSSVTCSPLRNMYKWWHLRRRRGSPSMHLTHASLILASEWSEWSRSSFGKASRMMRHLGSRLTRRIGACSSPPFASANFGWAARASFFLFLTLALLAVTPHYSHPHPLPRSEARESNKATWVVAYLVLLLVLALLSPSFHLSSSLFLLLSFSVYGH